MTELFKIYRGAQDYCYPEKWNPLTIESEYMDTQKEILTCVDLEKRRQMLKFNQEVNGERCEDIGFVGLRFEGDASAVEYIEFEAGGMLFDKIYPFLTGELNGITYFDSVVPNTIHHTLIIRISFKKTHSPIEVYYERVKLKNLIPDYEYFAKTTQYTGGEDVEKGPGFFKLYFNHPVEYLQIFSGAPLTNTYVEFDTKYKVYVCSKEMKNGFYFYELYFNNTVNFSRSNVTKFLFDAAESTTIHVFAKHLSPARYMAGYCGLRFAK